MCVSVNLAQFGNAENAIKRITKHVEQIVIDEDQMDEILVNLNNN